MSEILFKEIFRKSIHLTGILIPIIYYFIEFEAVIFWLGLLVAIMWALEFLRLRGYIKFPSFLLRSHEKQNIAAYIYSTTAILIVIIIFPKNIAIVATTMLIIGDTSSGIAGAFWGKKANLRQGKDFVKPIPILFIMFLSSFLSGYIAIHISLLEFIPTYSIALGALGATISDGVLWEIRGKIIDDNLTIPIVSASLIFVSYTGFT